MSGKTGAGSLLRQHNVITEARYDMSVLEKDLLYLLIERVSPSDPPQKGYIISTEEIRKYFPKVSSDSLFAATSKILTRRYSIKSGNGALSIFTLISYAAYDDEAEELRLKISPSVHPYLVEIKGDCTEYWLGTAISLKSKYSKRIYEMLSQHKESGGFDISLSELKERLFLLDKKSGEEKLPTWSDFKKNVLERAQKELAEKSGCFFTYEGDTANFGADILPPLKGQGSRLLSPLRKATRCSPGPQDSLGYT